MFKIAQSMLEKREYTLNGQAQQELVRQIRRLRRGDPESFGNARAVRNLVEQVIRRQAVRLVQKRGLTKRELTLITSHDFRGLEP